jgi:glycosyltransferase involved in cell wall biosynthesis
VEIFDQGKLVCSDLAAAQADAQNLAGSSADGGAEEIVRVAFDYQVFFLQSYGGISRYFARLAQGLSDLGQQVRIFAALYRNNYLPALSKEIVSGRHISRYPPKTGRLILAYNHFRSGPMIAKWKPDLVHETYFSAHPSAPGTCPTVITVYDMIHELFPKAFPVADDTAARKRIAIDRADHVICISENTKSDLLRLYGTPAGKVSVVHLGFDQFAPQADSKQPVAAAGKPFLLYVGARGGHKNFIGLLKAVASSPRLLSDFDIIAIGGPPFSANELEIMSSLGFGANQVRQESGSDSLLGCLYGSARALVYPSLYEGFGIPPLEAMAHRCPVISSNSSSMPEVIGSAGEYFDPHDLDDMRQVIEAVVYSDSRVALLKKSGSERLNAFSWKKCTQETLDIYKTLTA